MPSTCRSFVKANMELMSDEALMGIVDYLKKRNADIPEVESAIDKIDSDNWIYMQEDLEAELLTRQMFYKAQEKTGDMEKLRFCIQKYIYADTTIGVNDADEIRKRAERIFNSSTYKKQVERSKKNWLDLSVDEVLKKDLEFICKV